MTDLEHPPAGTPHREWEVDVLVLGPVRIDRHSLRARKGALRPDRPAFYSKVEVGEFAGGMIFTATALAPDQSLALKAAVVFLGQTIDVLGVRIGVPLSLQAAGATAISRARPRVAPDRSGPRENVRALLKRGELEAAFHDSRFLAEKYPRVLRGLGWFRKGEYTEDPLDRFFAYWNALESVATALAADDERTRRGSKNKIWACFRRVWGPPENWKGAASDAWIDEAGETRNKIAHGAVDVTLDEVEAVSERVSALRLVVRRYLLAELERLQCCAGDNGQPTKG